MSISTLNDTAKCYRPDLKMQDKLCHKVSSNGAVNLARTLKLEKTLSVQRHEPMRHLSQNDVSVGGTNATRPRWTRLATWPTPSQAKTYGPSHFQPSHQIRNQLYIMYKFSGTPA